MYLETLQAAALFGRGNFQFTRRQASPLPITHGLQFTGFRSSLNPQLPRIKQ